MMLRWRWMKVEYCTLSTNNCPQIGCKAADNEQFSSINMNLLLETYIQAVIYSPTGAMPWRSVNKCLMHFHILAGWYLFWLSWLSYCKLTWAKPIKADFISGCLPWLGKRVGVGRWAFPTGNKCLNFTSQSCPCIKTYTLRIENIVWSLSIAPLSWSLLMSWHLVCDDNLR